MYRNKKDIKIKKIFRKFKSWQKKESQDLSSPSFKSQLYNKAYDKNIPDYVTFSEELIARKYMSNWNPPKNCGCTKWRRAKLKEHKKGERHEFKEFILNEGIKEYNEEIKRIEDEINEFSTELGFDYIYLGRLE